MPPKAYESCPCGSGKKFKWCCADSFDKVEQAMVLQARNQHASAIRVMDSAVRENPNHAPLWGHYAQLMAQEGDIDKAEEMLQKGFALQPDFPMGHMLRGTLLLHEGEVIGALILFRKAAEAYDPNAEPQLAEVQELIARCEVTLNRPVAARAALDRAVHYAPRDHELRQTRDGLFGPTSRLPESACKAYSLRPTAKPIPGLAIQTARLGDARNAYQELTAQVPDDPAAWFNLGVVSAWLGEQTQANDALKKSLELEWDDVKAEETGALLEVLSQAQGMENESDYVEQLAVMELRDPNALFAAIKPWVQQGFIIAPQMNEQQTAFSCMIVDPIPSIIETGNNYAKALATMLIAEGRVELVGSNAEGLRKVVNRLRQELNLALGEPEFNTIAAQIGDVAKDAIIYPTRVSDPEKAEAKVRENVGDYYENIWAHKPRHALNDVAPIDAAGSKLLRKRLLGIIKFQEEALAGYIPRDDSGEVRGEPLYDFNRLRHKLQAELQAPGEAPTINVPVEKKQDFSTMSAADLAQLDAESLSISELEVALRTALKLDARELAVRFAELAVAKPAESEKPDRYAFYACLITAAMAEKNFAEALKHAEHGQADDADHNNGKRANEYTLRQAQLQAKLKEFDAAEKLFNELIERNPKDGKYPIAAIEVMLSAQQSERALAFAERGLAQAKATNNRDLEAACKELAEAARRQQK